MECSRCCLQPVIYAFTKANLDNSLGRMKTKEIIAAVNNLKVVFNGVCAKCKELPLETPALIEKLNSDWAERIEAVLNAVGNDGAKVEGIIDELRNAFQVVCLTCSSVSNDDNPSNHGQTFVSLDSGSCQANSGRARSTHTDDNIVLSRADWIGLHRAPDYDESTFGTAPDTCLMMKEDAENGTGYSEETATTLPQSIEDKLRIEFSNFVSLDIIDKLLLSCIMSGMNIAEFAKMLWFPYSIVDPKTRMVKSITKQAAHARWINICKRFPVFMSVAVSSAKDKKSMEKLRKFIMNPNGDAPSDKFQNGKVSPAFMKAERRAKELEERRTDERIRRLENEAGALRKANESLKGKLREEKEKAAAAAVGLRYPSKKARAAMANQTDLIPGLF